MSNQSSVTQLGRFLTEDGTFQGSMAFMLERHSTEVAMKIFFGALPSGYD